jgi:hypothetical protein
MTSSLATYPMIGTIYDPAWETLGKWAANATTVLHTVERFDLGKSPDDVTKQWYALALDIFELTIENDTDYDGHYHPHHFSKNYPDHNLSLVYHRLVPITIDEDYYSDVMFAHLERGDKWVHIDVRYYFADECWLTVIASSLEDAIFLLTFFRMIGDSLAAR